MKINKITLRHLRNDTHFQFHTEFKDLALKHNPQALKIKPQYISLAVGVVLAMAFIFSCSSDGSSSAFAGKWVRDDGSESLELFKDGTGVAKKGDEGMAISWKVVENKRFVITASMGFSQSYNYEISGSELTFTDDKGESETYVKFQEWKIEGKTLTDKRDGKKYKTVIIGTQTWMAENLNYDAEGSKCYDDKPENCSKYGRIYNWETAKEVCPNGWHLPSDEEWTKLTGYIGGERIAGKKLKSKSNWNNDGNGTDNYGFSALPSGRYGFKGNSFDNAGNNGYWWSASEESVRFVLREQGDTSPIDFDVYSRYISYDSEDFSRSTSVKSSLRSVRCLQD